MFTLNGKYNTAKVYTDCVDNETTSQIINLLNQQFVENSKICIMPDCHAGTGCVIGTTITITDKIVPGLVGVDIGCLDKDTEILTPAGWIPINQYCGQKILVYDKTTDTAFYDKPYAYIKAPCDKFYHFHSGKGLDQMLSAEHKMLIWHGYKNKGYMQEIKLAKDVFGEHNKNIKSNRAIKTTFDFKNTGLDISDELIRIWVMVSADGCIRKRHNTHNQIELHFRKHKKIKRAQQLLNAADIKYSIYNAADNTVYINFNVPTMIEKSLIQFYNASKSQLATLIDEIYYWDGSIDKNRNHKNFSTTDKTNADVVQFALNANGIRAGIQVCAYKDKPNWNSSYIVYQTQNEYVGFPARKFEEKPSVDNLKYCFATSTGFFIIRRSNNISITGNCGMLAVKLKETEIDLPELDRIIHKYVPAGGCVHNNPRTLKTKIDVEELACYKEANIREMLAYCSIGTLGGGNHFVELDRDSNGNLWLVIHTGSRHLGLEVANFYQNKAYELLTEKHNGGTYKSKLNTMIAQMKTESKQKEIESAITKFKQNYKDELPSIPKDLAYLEGEYFEKYLHDMKLCQQYAHDNRAEIASTIIQLMSLHEVERFETIHNYIDLDNMILRKGAVSAQKDEKLIIPMNMRDGSLLCVGKGNPDWNCSAPHGAGRLMSRSKAKEVVSMSEFAESMNGIYTTSVNQSTIDESPMAYKPMDSIVENIADTVDICDIIKPIYNFKASM